MSNINILSSAKYEYLKKQILKNKNFNNIEIEYKRFPDKEKYYRILNSEQISGKPAVYISATVDDEAILEAYHICSALIKERCSSLHFVVPYFGYSTMERATLDGEIVSAKNIARLLSSLSPSANGNYIYVVDLHAPGTEYYFEQNLHPVHLTTMPIIDKMIEDISKKSKNIVLASADMGRAKMVEKISNRLGLNGAYIMKKRLSGKDTVVEALNADVKGKNVIIIDDMIRTGSSTLNAAKAYKSIGAKNIYVICIHGIFINNAIETFKKSGIIKGVYCTNTHVHAQNIKDKFVKVYDISEVILNGLKKQNID